MREHIRPLRLGASDAALRPGVVADPLAERMRATAGLVPLVADAEAVWRRRARVSADAELELPVWRPFEDAFPTFYQFTNRPPR